MMFLCKLLYLTVFWHDQSRYKFPLVCNNGHLINITIYHQLGFNGLRSNVLTIGSFKQILDSVRQVQETILHISGISRTKPAIFCKCLLGDGFFLIISLRYGTSTKLYLVISPIRTSTPSSTRPTAPKRKSPIHSQETVAVLSVSP